MMANTNISTFTKLLPVSIRKEANNIANNGNNMRDLGGGDGGGMSSINNAVIIGGPLRQGGEQREVVRVTVTYPTPSCGAMNPHKEISLRLTNDENPLFFYHLRITEVEFPNLKNQQGLLVDFYGFPNQLVTLLEKCVPSSERSNEDGTSGGLSLASGGFGPKFLLVMKIGGQTVLDIVESNPFKYLCHLSLQIDPGTDFEVKKYLGEVTSNLKRDHLLLQEKYSHLTSGMETELARLKSLLDQKSSELNQVRDDVHSQAGQLATKHFQEMTQEKEKLLKLQSELASKFDYERHELEKRHGQVVLSLEDRVNSLETENRELIQCKYKNETALQDASSRMKNYEDDLKILQQELTLSRKQNGKLDQDYHEKQRVVNTLHNKITTMEADLKEKNHSVQRQQEFIAQLSEQKKFLEDHVSNLVKEVDKLKQVNHNVSTELIKANEIIKKLQDDIRNSHSRRKLQNQITAEQERAIQDRDKLIQQLEKEVQQTKTSLESTQSEMERVNTELSESQKTIETLDKSVKSNENMIAWLNKQLNEFQGLSNLSKFRQNVSTNSAHPTQPLGNNSNQNLSHQSHPNYSLQGNPIVTSTSRDHPQTQGNYSNSNNSNGNSNFTVRKPGVFSSNNQSSNNTNSNNCTLPGTTPSWLHIYQSTSTPLEEDLSSRLEQVQASGGLNYNLRKNGLDTISEKTGENSTKSLNPNPNPLPNNSSGAKSISARAPTWAKGRGKVILDSNAVYKPVAPGWRKSK